MRIGIFGGTFDPLHTGHLVAAINAKAAAALDTVLFVVANRPWQKEHERGVTSAGLRFELVSAALEGIPGLVASDIEIARGGVSYTYETLLRLRTQLKEASLFLIVGADVSVIMHTWGKASLLHELAELIVVNRPGYDRPSQVLLWKEFVSVEIPSLDISSTDLRQRFRDGRPLDFLMPIPAITFAKERGLYRD